MFVTNQPYGIYFRSNIPHDLHDTAFRAFDLTKDAANSFCQAPNATAKSDMLRLALLWHWGGTHLDADDRIVGPQDDLLPPGVEFVGYQNECMCVANNFLAAAAGHPGSVQ